GAAHYQKLRTALKAGKGAPDVAQVEFQYISSFTVTDSLLNLAPYGASGLGDQYVPWVWNQVKQGDAVYAIPQDSGPMGNLYREDILAKAGITTPPKTWDEYAADAAKIHQANANQYITFFSQSDPNWYTGLLWQNGAQLFSDQGGKVKVSIADNPKVTQVNQYWQKLISQKLVATNLQGFSPELYKAWNDGTVLSWISAAWGYSTIRDNAKDTSGKWAVAPIPQWTAGGTTSGNWGGSSTAVFSSSKHPAEAAKFALWLNTDPDALALENKLGGLYPAAKAGLDIPSLQQGVDFYGGEKIFDVFKQASAGVATNFQWGPTMTDTYSALKDGIVGALSGSGTLDAATQSAQTKTIASLKAQNVPIAN
ncbi:MAG: extracellular solute-binding protein, partial [Jatrophihabitans sp.]|uniref:extracellular solute-binding protein n=1 Tax=Jatrophihabitans sp. TaxID=1932789 RepID=UPI003F80F392